MLFLFGIQRGRLSESGTRGRRNAGFTDLSRAESRSAALCGGQNCGILRLLMKGGHAAPGVARLLINTGLQAGDCRQRSTQAVSIENGCRRDSAESAPA